MTPRETTSKQRSNAGFALIASISIMAVLVLIGVTLYSLSAVATKSAEIAKARTEAQANAKMALMLAIGDLQRSLGPDQRVTARGSTLAQHPNFETPVDIETNSSKAWWVGVSSAVEKIEPAETEETEDLKDGKSVVWLLSGLNPDTSSSEQLSSGLFPSLRKITLFGENSIDLSLTGGEPIQAGAVPLSGKSDSEVIGSYAYFVDDNGMKAQLTTKHPDLINGNTELDRAGGSVIPGFYDLGILEGMGDFAGLPFRHSEGVISLCLRFLPSRVRGRWK